MMTFFIVLAAAAQAYLLGSVDTGILVSKYLYHDDVRNHGSGAAGMTNMLRTFGKKAAALTAAGDVLKGVAGGGRCHPGDPTHPPAGADRRFSALPCAHRHGVAGKHCNGGILSGADPHLRPAQGLRR